MSATVRIESAGDHAFDLPHLRRQGGEALVELLLQKADFTGDLSWRLRVEKKLTCTGETRPVAVVGWKPWCCYLKIKPGDNDSCHYCSLLVPDGFRGEAVYEAVKRVEHLIDRNWRNGTKARVTTMADTNDVPKKASAEGRSAAAGGAELELSGLSKDGDKLRLTLLAIDEADRAGPYASQAHFVEALADKLGWEGASRHAIGGVFTSLVRRGYIINVRQGCKSVGYALSPEGRGLIKDLLPPDARPKEPLSPPPAADPSELMGTLARFTQEYADTWKRLQQIRVEREDHQKALERLDAETRELSKVVENPEVCSLLQRLLQIAGKPPS